MGLQGNLRTILLPDVLQWISQSRKSGILHVRDPGGVSKRILFKKGDVLSTASSDPREYLGHFLISHGYLSEEQLNLAMDTQIQTGIKLGKILVTVGVLEEEDLKVMLKLKAEENVYDLFLWEEGEFNFEDRDAIDEDIPYAPMDVTSLVMEGIRRKDEWARIRALLPNRWVILSRVPGKEGEAENLAAGALARRALELFDGQRSLEEVALELHATEFQVAEAAFRLCECGLLTVTGQKIPPEEQSYRQIREQLLREASKALEESEFTKATNLYRYLTRTDPQDAEARQGLAMAERGASQVYFRDVMPLNTVLELAVPLSELAKYDLSPQEGFLATRANGAWDIATILKISPMPEKEALRSLQKLLERKVLRPKSR
ncbi:MAG: DUF4388 domain-containing protein [Acidobacteriota bacterium]